MRSAFRVLEASISVEQISQLVNSLIRGSPLEPNLPSRVNPVEAYTQILDHNSIREEPSVVALRRRVPAYEFVPESERERLRTRISRTLIRLSEGQAFQNMPNQAVSLADYTREASDAVRSAAVVQNNEALDELNAFIREMVIGDLSAIDGDLTVWMSAYAYQGFNATAIINFLRTKEPSKERLAAEMFELILIMLMRGTSIATPGKEKMNPACATRFLQQKRKYVILPKLDRATATDKTITMSRLAAAFPTIAYRLLVKKNPPRPLSNAFMEGKGFPDFPPGLKGNYIFSVIPQGVVTDRIRGAVAGALAYMAFESHVLRAKDLPPLSDMEALLQCSTYARAAYTSSDVDAATRSALFNMTTMQAATVARYLTSFAACFPDADYLKLAGLN